MSWRDWFGRKKENGDASIIEYKCFFDAAEDVRANNRTVAETLRHYCFESDPLRILGRYTEFALRHARYRRLPPYQKSEAFF